jgi:hypothetical protein
MQSYMARQVGQRSSLQRYTGVMTRSILLLPLLLAACASGPTPLPPPDAEVRPVVQRDNLQGRWTITAVNGQQASGYWLDLGAEGVPNPRDVERAKGINITKPATRARIGANDWADLSWTRNGDKLQIVGGRQTERGFADPVAYAQEEQAGRILRLPMTMELTPPDRLRLINESGTLDLVRSRS